MSLQVERSCSRIIIAVLAASAAIVVLTWKIQIRILFHAICLALISLGILLTLALNFAVDQSDSGWLGSLGVHCLAVGFLALVGGLIRSLSHPRAKPGKPAEKMHANAAPT